MHDLSCPNLSFDVPKNIIVSRVSDGGDLNFSLEWLNKLLGTLWEAWKTAKPFHKLVVEEIYVAINKGRPNFLSEVVIVGMILEGQPP